MFKWSCPSCYRVVTFTNIAAMRMAAECGGCAACRAMGTMSKASAAVNTALVDFFQRKGWLDEPVKSEADSVKT